MKHYLFVIIWTLIMWNPITLMRQGTGRLHNLIIMLIVLAIFLLLVYFSAAKFRTLVCALLVIGTLAFHVRLFYQSGFTDEYMPQMMANIYNKKLPKDCHLELIKVGDKETEMVSYRKRKIVLVNYKGFNIPFYLSTGFSNKKNVQAGLWYPFFGIDKEGWFNKGSQDVINLYYKNDLLKDIALSLDNAIGDIRKSNRGVVITLKNSAEFEQVRKQINRDVRGDKPYLDPNGVYQDISGMKAGDVEQFYRRIKRVLNTLDSLRQQ